MHSIHGENENEERTQGIKSREWKVNGRGGKRGTYFVGNATITYGREGMEIVRPVVDSLVSDFDAIEHVFDYAFDDCLHVNPQEHPLMLADPVGNTREKREKMCQLLFEHYKSPCSI